jgi:hypothetical protein
MKYIKQYESEPTNNKFWKVSTNMPNFEICLYKIGMPEKKIIDFLKPDNYNDAHKQKNVYVAVEYYPSALNGIWTWDENAYGMANFMGKVKVTEDDIQRWNLKNNQNKYNL